MFHTASVYRVDDEYWCRILLSDALPGINHMREMQYQIVLNIKF